MQNRHLFSNWLLLLLLFDLVVLVFFDCAERNTALFQFKTDLQFHLFVFHMNS